MEGKKELEGYIELESNREQFSDLEYLKTRIRGLQVQDLNENIETQYMEKYFKEQEQTQQEEQEKIEEKNNTEKTTAETSKNEQEQTTNNNENPAEHLQETVKKASSPIFVQPKPIKEDKFQPSAVALEQLKQENPQLETNKLKVTVNVKTGKYQIIDENGKMPSMTIDMDKKLLAKRGKRIFKKELMEKYKDSEIIKEQDDLEIAIACLDPNLYKLYEQYDKINNTHLCEDYIKAVDTEKVEDMPTKLVYDLRKRTNEAKKGIIAPLAKARLSKIAKMHENFGLVEDVLRDTPQMKWKKLLNGPNKQEEETTKQEKITEQKSESEEKQDIAKDSEKATNMQDENKKEQGLRSSVKVENAHNEIEKKALEKSNESKPDWYDQELEDILNNEKEKMQKDDSTER